MPDTINRRIVIMPDGAKVALTRDFSKLKLPPIVEDPINPPTDESQQTEQTTNQNTDSNQLMAANENTAVKSDNNALIGWIVVLVVIAIVYIKFKK